MDDIVKIQNYFLNHEIPISNKKILDKIKSYSFFYVSDIEYLEDNSVVYKKMKDSKFIIINRFKKLDNFYFIIVFELTIIMIHQNSIFILEDLFLNNPELEVCFLQDTKKYFNEKSNIKYNVIKSDYHIDVDLYIRNSTKEKLLISILISFLQYLIEKCSKKMSQKNRIKDFSSEIIQPKIYEKDDYIKLKIISCGSIFRAHLIYSFEDDDFLIIKEPYTYDDEIPKLLKREIKNYQTINHPLLPKFYGLTKDTNYLVLEFINGNTLLNTNKKQLTKKEKINIIFQIMMIICYFHAKRIVLRDLKSDNIMIDHNKTVVFIDFDRAIFLDSILNNDNLTKQFNSYYVSPEVFQNSFTEKCDIYSLGKIIYEIIIEKNAIEQNIKQYHDFKDYHAIKKIVKSSINNDPNKRQNIFDLINYYFKKYKSYINIDNLHIYIETDDLSNKFTKQMNLGDIFYKGEIVKRDINKAISYYTVAANNNNKAQLNLGFFYFDGEYVPRDINKAIYYFTLAAEHMKDIKLQLMLGNIYYENLVVPRDITKAIYYYSMAANQNNPEALYILGIIYSEGKYIKRNINKAIRYFKLASDLKEPNAQYNLGLIFFENQLVPRDIDKAIHFFSLAANQNIILAQNKLGDIYSESEYNKVDIHKAIRCYMHAANQNDPYAQFNLGIIYEGEFIQRDVEKIIYYYSLAAEQNYKDAQYYLGLTFLYCKEKQDIKKAIHYLTLAANQNDLKAQLHLALIYENGKYILRDINKSIYYFTLAANQNNLDAQYILGDIYFSGKFIPCDIQKSIYYISLAANQNHKKSQFYLGIIYFCGIHYLKLAADQNEIEAQYNLGLIYYYNNKFIKGDINKAIHYLSLAAKQNYSKAQCLLGEIYYLGKRIPPDFDKAFYYISLAANQNDIHAQYLLGIIYYDGKYIPQDIKKSVHYFLIASEQNHKYAQYFLGFIFGLYFDFKKAFHYLHLASNQNFSEAQYLLGLLYQKISLQNKAYYYFKLASDNNHPIAQYNLGIIEFEKNNYNKAIQYFHLSATNGCFESFFILGFINHVGFFIERNIQNAIKYYKEASSFNFHFAKNNLGILYKNGFNDEIKQNFGLANEYFQEGIHQKNDKLCMYNISHMYFYNESINVNIDLSIKYLIESSKQGFNPSKKLLCLVIIKKFGCNLDKIKNMINKQDNSNKLSNIIIEMIQNNQLNDFKKYQQMYELFRSIDYLYDNYFNAIPSYFSAFFTSQKYTSKAQNISKDFYSGFGDDLL